MQFYLDENLSPRVATLARALGVDVTSTHGDDRTGESDDSKLSYAAAQGRCLVTKDEIDYLELTRRFAEAARPHAGVLIVRWPVPAAAFNLLALSLVRFDRANPNGMSAYGVNWLPFPMGA